MKVSIIIPTLNEEKNIGRLLDSIRATKYPKKEILVIDGNSKDNTVKIARSKGAHVIREYGPQKCCANAKNIGVKEAKYDIILILNADSEGINKSFISEAVRLLKDPRNVGVAPEVIKILPTFWSKVLYHSRTLVHFTLNLMRKGSIKLTEKQISWFPNFIRKKTFEEIGGYPLRAYEDRTFLINFKNYLEKNRAKCPYSKKSKLYLKDPETLSDIFRQTKWYSRVGIPYIAKTGDIKELVAYIASLVQFVAIISYFLMSDHPIFLLLAILYTIKVTFIFLYILLFKGSTYNSKHFALAIPLLDFLSGVWKFIGILEYIKIRMIKSNRLYSRGK